MHHSSKSWSKVNLLHRVHVLRAPAHLRARAVISPCSQSWRNTAETSSFLFHPVQGLLYCVTAELKGGICDLISPDNIKEKQCFIHRRKAPDFTQIKFACLCLRDQAWDLTHIEMIGFLRGIKIKINKKKKKAWERGGDEGEVWGRLIKTDELVMQLWRIHLELTYKEKKICFSPIPFSNPALSFEKVRHSQIPVTLAPCWFPCFVGILSSRVLLSKRRSACRFHFFHPSHSDLPLSKKF